LEDGTTIEQRKDKCNPEFVHKEGWEKKYDEIVDKSKRTIRIKSQLFKGIKEGMDVPLDFTEFEKNEENDKGNSEVDE